MLNENGEIVVKSVGWPYKAMFCKEHIFEHPGAEVLDRWKGQVDDLIEASRTPGTDFNQNLSQIFGNTEIPEKATVLFAIGSFILEHKSKWHGDWPWLKLLTSGQKLDLAGFGENVEERNDTCLHAAVIKKLLADEYGISGNIEGGYTTFSANPSTFNAGAHYLWREEAEDGYILDTHLCPKVNGLLLNQADYAVKIAERKKEGSTVIGGLILNCRRSCSGSLKGE